MLEAKEKSTSARIAIVIPVLDEDQTIGSALQALQPFRLAGAQIIVVDGGSQDRTAELAVPLADRVIVSPRGRGAQMNTGASACDAEILIFLHADTRLPDGALDSVRRAIVGGATWGRFDVAITGTIRGLGMVSFMMNWRSRLSGIATGDQAIFVSRQGFEAVGSFPDIALMEDLVLSRRLRAQAWPACLRDNVETSGRRWERNGLWRTIWAMWRLRLRFYLGANPADLAREYGYTPRQS